MDPTPRILNPDIIPAFSETRKSAADPDVRGAKAMRKAHTAFLTHVIGLREFVYL
jgi:hypothetical protein